MTEYEKGQWEMFEEITSAIHGKQYYFLEEDGMAWSRYSHKYMTRDEAYAEFYKWIDDGWNV